MAMREIAGCPGYYVTQIGTVWSMKSGQLRRLRPRADEEGYLHVDLCSGNRRREVAIHRMVAQEWCHGWHPSCEVHHIDCDPSNNRAANLACLTAAEHALAHHIWQPPDKVRRERERMNELIAASRPPVRGEPPIRSMLRAIESAQQGLDRRGIAL